MRNRLRRLVITIIVVGGSVAALTVRIQPDGTATIFRTARSVLVKSNRVYVRPFGSVSACRTPALDSTPQADLPVRILTATNDEAHLRVRLQYMPPQAAANDWPSGDWCTALTAIVTRAANGWSGRERTEDLLADRRAVQDAARAAIERDLEARGVTVQQLRVALELPTGFERLRSHPPIASAAEARRPVIFIGLDGADWELLDDYIANGSMPVMQSLVGEGASGILLTEHPPLSPLLWTTMFTGVGPLEHQILDFTRFNPYTKMLEPITSDERRTPAVWNMMTAAGKTTAMFGAWATYAAEPVHGVNVSDRFFTFLFSDRASPAGAVYPDLRSPWAREHLEDAEASVTVARLRQYLPALTDGEYAAASAAENPYADPTAALRRILVETEVYRRLALDYLGRGSLPDLSIVYLQGTDTVGHVFAPFTPPRQPQIPPADYERYNGVPQRYFGEVDAIIGAFVRLARQHDAVIVLASDHGFRWKEGRPLQLSSFAAASAAKWHRNEGIFVLWGRGIAATAGHTLSGSIRQICATLGALTGIPSAAGTEVKPLPGVTPPVRSVDYRASFQIAAAPPPPASSTDSSEEIAKLRALGYIGSAEPVRAQAGSRDTRTAGSFNNAGLIQRQQKDAGAAIASFERALTIDPGYASAEWNLSETLFDAGRLDRSDDLLVRAMGHGLPDGSRQVVARSMRYQRSDRSQRAQETLNAAIAIRPDDPELRLFRGRYRLDRNDCAGALDDFLTAARVRPDPIGFASTGLAHMCAGNPAAARASFERSLQLDPNQPMLRQYMSELGSLRR